MITAREARKLINKDVAIEECKRRTEESIIKAISKGVNKCCLSNTGCYITEDGKVGGCKDAYVDCKSEIKSWLNEYGYKIEPTGYVGGVYQDSEDIVW